MRLSLLVVSVVFALALPLPAASQDAAKPGPVEAFFCNFVDGKGMKDLKPVADNFSKWADKHYPGYSAWILTPRFAVFGEQAQVIWLGSTDSGDTMGKGIDAWNTTSGDLQAQFNKVIECGGHGLASSVPVNAPDGSPENGVVMFMECAISDGSDWSKAVAAHREYAKAMRAMGAKNSNWAFFPMIGGQQDRDFDYWSVSTFESWSDYFAAYEIYVNGGGWQKAAELMSGKAECEAGSPSVWDFRLVRSGAAS